MVPPPPQPKIYHTFVAGYMNLTPEEFNQHYRSQLDYHVNNIDARCIFLLSDEAGICDMSIPHLRERGVPAERIRIYRTSGSVPVNGRARPYPISEYEVTIVDGEESERYQAMTGIGGRDGHSSVMWLREEDVLHGRIGTWEWLDSRFEGAREAVRVVQARKLRAAMEYYDSIA